MKKTVGHKHPCQSDPDELRIAIALRTGANILESTECCCGKFVDRLRLHGVSCIKNAGRFPRHSAINSILKRSLTRIGLPSVLEHVGLMKDRRRPDGLTLNPWCRGRSLAWDATVVDTFAESHYIVSAAIPGSVATDAETNKCWKYNDLLDNYYFQPVRQLQSKLQVCSVYGKSTSSFFSCLAKKLVDMSGDPRERQWLHQHLSLAVVRGNTASILACVQV